MQQAQSSSIMEVAKGTRKDSSPMRTIPIVTMTFLPGTAIAVRRSRCDRIFLYLTES
jgi:hypothetical protein